MTARDALADGRLSDALELQRQSPGDEPADQLFLFELLVLAGQLDQATIVLELVGSTDPHWPSARLDFRRLLRGERRRAPVVRRPQFLLDPPPHARRRWNATLAHRRGDADTATRWLDRADAATPEVSGHVNGREFTGLRDSDDRFASVFELIVQGRYVWVPFEQVRSLKFAEEKHLLDSALRPGQLRLTDGRQVPVLVPLLYPDSAREGDDTALGNTVDWSSADAGLVCGVGARVLTFGEEDTPLNECRMIEIRPS